MRAFVKDVRTLAAAGELTQMLAAVKEVLRPDHPDQKAA
jgi:hypothetical protein